MNKTNIALLIFIFAFILLLSTFISVKADATGISVYPDYQAVPWNYPLAEWLVDVVGEPGCLETNLKYRAVMGDGFTGEVYNVVACMDYYNNHKFPTYSPTTWTQSWYYGEGGGSWHGPFNTEVYEYIP